jgi:hypothetical protein
LVDFYCAEFQNDVQERSKETNATCELEAQLAEARSLLDDMEAKVIAADAEKYECLRTLIGTEL